VGCWLVGWLVTDSSSKKHRLISHRIAKKRQS